MNSGRTPDEYRRFFAEIFAALDARPEAMKVKVFAEGLVIDLRDGNPVFTTPDGATCAADYRRRWLAEHPVPITLPKTAVFAFEPTTGNRVKVRIR